ncbi:MAG TPA: porin family protein [Gemmatimonadaceae bacterium]|nr:porin family protein [Gemmatimonadaceae bacterium]
MSKRFIGAPLVALALLASSANAQHVGTSFGILVGGNFSDLKGNDVVSANIGTRTGLVAGVSLNVHLVGGWGLEPEILYSQQGASINSSNVSAEGTIAFDYIQVPLLARWTIPLHGKVRPFVVGGPSFGYQIGCSLEASGQGGSASESCDSIEGYERYRFDVSGVAGAGVAFAVGHQAFTVQGRYNYGFQDVQDGSDAKNRGFSLLGGFEFR